jgi:hypothetical protein
MIPNSRIASILFLLLPLGCAPVQSASSPVVGAPSVSPTLASPSPGAFASVSPVVTPSVAPASNFLSGVIYDDEVARVPGVTVTATVAGQPPVTTVTSTDGSYRLAVLPGSTTVTATKAGWVQRTRMVTVTGPTTLDFGSINADGNLDPHFLSNNPEIVSVNVKEEAPGGPLSMAFTMSEPLTLDSQKNFSYRFTLDSGSNTPFLNAAPNGESYLNADSSWDASGTVFTFKTKGPYLPSGPGGNVFYTAYLKQTLLTTQDPVTREFQYDDLQITDSEGKALGKNRAAYAFLQDPLSPLTQSVLNNFAFGYYTDSRRWNLTHKGNYILTAATDNVAPQLLAAAVAVNAPIGSTNEDLMRLRFNKPMHAIKDRDNLEFTRLSTDLKKQMVIVSVSKNSNGSGPTPLNPGPPRSIQFSRTDPNLVIFHFQANTFKDQQWVDVTLGADVRDPANNLPDPLHSHISGAVVGSTSAP